MKTINGITFNELLMTLCCGEHCNREGEHCHRFDFIAEAYRVKSLLERKRAHQDKNDGA
jgi:hypothetical protein